MKIKRHLKQGNMKAYYNKLYLFFRNKFIVYSSVAIILSTIIGSLAIMFSLMQGISTLQMFQVFLSVIICSFVNVSVLTVQHPRVVLNLFLLVYYSTQL
jgi:hypothetical protein